MSAQARSQFGLVTFRLVSASSDTKGGRIACAMLFGATTRMKLFGSDLLEHITYCFSNDPTQFPRNGSCDYPSLVRGWIARISATILPHVTVDGVAIDGGRLTAHDGEHVKRVLYQAGKLLEDFKGELSAFEVTLLVCAIYMHDVGNALGRAGHESAATKVLNAAGAPLPFEGVENRAVTAIARAHGGLVRGDRNTIGTLQEELPVWSLKVRLRVLAGILRLADELADDPARSSTVARNLEALPKGAEVYHWYAAGLTGTVWNSAVRVIDLHFNFFDSRLFMRKLGKGQGSVYLIDEIIERTFKTFTEARYCSRFLRPMLEFDAVSVNVSLFDHDESGDEIVRLAFAFREIDYAPDPGDILRFAPQLCQFEGGQQLNGESLANHILNRLRKGR